MQKIDLKKELRQLYNPSKKEISVVDVPAMNFLTIDGTGDPNTAQQYKDAVESLFSVSYALKFMIKKGKLGIDYAVMPLEGLWWTEKMEDFSVERKDDWQWTAMIMQPKWVTKVLVKQAIEQVKKKKGFVNLKDLHFTTITEGKAAQIMYIGPYANEAPTIQKIHDFIKQSGNKLSGKHHEIYLNDLRRSAPEKPKTILRQPFE
ncbi:MAG: GyrI-like domain-containing protein [Gammaproteobacteria bacterium]|jgi:hypothetical protein